MEAKEKSLAFLGATMVLEIPFFQRRYVWTESNWEELLDNLLDKNQSHFLGSIILKQEKVPVGDVQRALVIDGQQRLTTLSILMRAIYDTLPLENLETGIQVSIKEKLDSLLFYKTDLFSSDQKNKIEHSQLDSSDYERVIRGSVSSTDALEKIVLRHQADDEKKASSNIFQCYKYFVLSLKDKEPSQRMDLFNALLRDDNHIIVKIDLDHKENEQAIFDTVNTAGVRLTCADTIKNALFQKAMENARKGGDKKNQQQVIGFYNEHWKPAFEGSQDSVDFWLKERSVGRLVRNNVEILLHCFAVIKDIFNPAANKMADLPIIYKQYISKMDNQQLFDLIREIEEYANLYKDKFLDFDKSSLFEFTDSAKRLFHVLDVCEVSTFHPYLLFLFKTEKEAAINNKLTELSTYVIRHIICGETTKNFNKECLQLIRHEKTIEGLFDDKSKTLSDQAVLDGLHKISNKLASLLLFWIELKRRKESNNKADLEVLKYAYSLEHLMPQKWQEFWNVAVIPVYDFAGNLIDDQIEAENERAKSVYMIGNMTLLTSSLNTSLRNYVYPQKIEGDTRKSGIRKYADLLITKEVLNTFDNVDRTWDERKIQERTKLLQSEIVSIWPQL